MQRIGIMLVFLAATAASIADAATLSCRGGIISSGDRSIDVIAKCGDPDLKESHQEVLRDPVTNDKVFVTVEEWTFNFGPTQFMRVVILKNGVVADIRTGNYGYAQPVKPSPRDCSEQIVSVGDAKFDVLAKCGEPTLKDSHVEEFRETADGAERKVFITVEEWTYNMGPNRLVRILTFKNGKLTDIRSGGYGY